MGSKKVMVLEVYNATDEQIKAGLGKAFNDFCEKYKDTGIIASALKEDAAEKVIEFINEEDGL